MKNRRDFLKNLMAGACATFTLHTLCSNSVADQRRKPNVLMIVSDDLNDYLGVMDGHPQAKTPNLDKLARQGVLFANAHSNAPICAPSRASFMTGILPTTSKNYGFGKWQKNSVLKSVKTLPEYFRENGYKAYYTGKVDHQPKYSAWDGIGLKQYHGPVAYNGKEPVPHPSVPSAFGSIGLLDGTFASLADIPAVPASKDAPGYTGWWHARRNKPFRYVNYDDRDKMWDEESADWFRGKIKSLENDKNHGPFFIAFGIMSPHTPHVAPQKYFHMYPLKSLKIPVIKEGDNEDCKYDEVLGGKGRTHFTALKESYSDLDEGLRAYVQAYLACVSFVDDIVGDVMSTLDNSKFKDNTIVILFSDHGYNMGEKDYLFKNSLWEESTRIPFIIRDPRYATNAGKTVDHPISLIDVYPTIKDLCDLKGSTVKNKQGAELDGHSLKPFLENPKSGTWDGPDVALSVVHENYSVRSNNYRYIHYSIGSEELYDHTEDSYEWYNVADDPKYAKIKEKLKAQLLEMVPSVPKAAANKPANGNVRK
jgi:arylsulfatase A-like enzyme